MTVNNDFVLGDVLPASWPNAVADVVNGIQSGTATGTTDANGLISVTFPSAYASAPVVVACRNQTGGTSELTCHVLSVSTTAFSVRNYTASTRAESVSVTVNWIAIGTLA